MSDAHPPSKPNLGAVRAVFFDLDDTLCAYWQASKTGMRKAFGELAPVGVSVDDMIRNWAAAFREFSPTIKGSEWYDSYLKRGEPTRTEQMRLMLRRMGIEDEVLAQRLSQRYMEERDAALSLFDHAELVLERLGKLYRLGLITNGPADIQRQEIDRVGIEKYFSVILIEGEMGEGKPNASVFSRAALEIGCAPEEILFVGNSYAHDVAPALSCGWRAIWVRRESDVPPSAGPEAVKPEQAPEGAARPDAIIGDLVELLPLLSA